ncbi:amidohydrolase family protein [Patescibacteria group bacterium]|nr:amidohydrolase family protein [Patescibacteria group bacterium]
MILIKAANIIDGTGKPAYRADILIKGGLISAIGNFSPKTASVVIDGLGRTVTPGFIDAHSDSDHYLTLLSDPQQEDSVRQGVTTIIGGHCGSSLAPLFYGSLKSIRKWGDPDTVNVDWHTVKEFRAMLRTRGIGVNFATLIGHSTVRRDLIGESFRDLTDPELDVFLATIRKGMNDGARGLSTGLGYVHASHVSYAEVRKLVSVAQKLGGVYTTHLRNEREGVAESVREVLAVAKDTGARTVISHLRPFRGNENEFRRALAAIDQGPSGAYFDVSPFAFSILPLYTLLPDWAQYGGFEEMLALLYDDLQRPRILAELKASAADLASYRIVDAKGAGALVGKTLKDFAGSRDLSSIPEALLALMERTRMKGLLEAENIDGSLLNDLLFHPKALIGSNAASFGEIRSGIRTERSTQTFSRFLELAHERGVSPEDAIARLTSVPAKAFGLEKRGVITEGAAADIVIHKDAAIEHVLVNGSFVLRDKQTLRELPGTFV